LNELQKYKLLFRSQKSDNRIAVNHHTYEILLRESSIYSVLNLDF